MNWLDRELSWGVAIQEQRHLIGRIGELYAALMTGGQMAPEVNQAGYDVVASDGERISVKTTTQEGPGGHLSFNPNTMDQVDRVMVFYLNIDEMQIETLLDASALDAAKLLSNSGGKQNLSLGKLRRGSRVVRPIEDQKVVAEAVHEPYLIKELESGSILVVTNGVAEPVVKPVLRIIAKEIGISILNSNGNPLTTRQLGAQVIRAISPSA